MGNNELDKKIVEALCSVETIQNMLKDAKYIIANNHLVGLKAKLMDMRKKIANNDKEDPAN